MSAAAYVMGHNDRERRRLALQAAILKPFTEHFLARAGISRGMNVLEMGCGVGDVTLITANLVGRRGRVTAVDVDDAALAIAEAKVRDQGFHNVSFTRASIDEYVPERPVDAVIGRHILIHTRDPLRVLQHAKVVLREGGIAAFQEFDFSHFPACHPPCPLRERVCAVFVEFFRRATHGDMGARLYHLLVKAGFDAADCRGEFMINGADDAAHYEWFAESLRSILPRAQQLGIGAEFVPTIDSLAEDLQAEAMELGASGPAPIMVGGFARKP